jgi:hypothetical protein
MATRNISGSIWGRGVAESEDFLFMVFPRGRSWFGPSGRDCSTPNLESGVRRRSSLIFTGRGPPSIPGGRTRDRGCLPSFLRASPVASFATRRPAACLGLPGREPHINLGDPEAEELPSGSAPDDLDQTPGSTSLSPRTGTAGPTPYLTDRIFMHLGKLEPEAPQGPETSEDGPEGHRRSTTDPSPPLIFRSFHRISHLSGGPERHPIPARNRIILGRTHDLSFLPANHAGICRDLPTQ